MTYAENDFSAKLTGVYASALPTYVEARFAKEYSALQDNYPGASVGVFYLSEVGEDFNFIGYSSRSPKYPFIVRMVKSGKIIKLSKTLAQQSKRVQTTNTNLPELTHEAV
jgi:hypothetical protein